MTQRTEGFDPVKAFLAVAFAAAVALGGSTAVQAAQAKAEESRVAATAEQREAALQQAYDRGYADAMAEAAA